MNVMLETNRREFLILSGLMAAAGAPAAGAGETTLAGQITRLQFLEDATALAMLSRKTPPVVAKALSQKAHLANVGGMMPAGNTPEPALAAGRMIHEAGLVLWQDASTEARLYRDAFLLREMYFRDTGREAPAAQAAAVEELFRNAARRALIALHTFIPDSEDVGGWLEHLIRFHDGCGDFYKRLAQVYSAADPAKLRQHVTAANFYNRADAAIQAAASIERGGLAGGREVEKAPGASLYAQALHRAILKLEAQS